MATKTTESITIRLDEEIRKKIAIQAEAEHRELSDFVRHAVITYLDKIEEVKKMTGH